MTEGFTGSMVKAIGPTGILESPLLTRLHISAKLSPAVSARIKEIDDARVRFIQIFFMICSCWRQSWSGDGTPSCGNERSRRVHYQPPRQTSHVLVVAVTSSQAFAST